MASAAARLPRPSSPHRERNDVAGMLAQGQRASHRPAPARLVTDTQEARGEGSGGVKEMKRRRIGPGVNRQCPRTTHDQQWWPPVAVAVAVWAAAASSTPSTYSNPRARGTHSSKANAAPAPPHPEGPAAAAARGPRGRNAAAAQTTTVRACTTATRPRASSARLPARGSGGARPRPRARSPRAGAWRRPPLQQEQRHTTDAPNHHPPPPPHGPPPPRRSPRGAARASDARRGCGSALVPRARWHPIWTTWFLARHSPLALFAARVLTHGQRIAVRPLSDVNNCRYLNPA